MVPRKSNNVQIRFPVKLLQLLDSSRDILTWNQNGTTILINMDALDEYLLTENSIFLTKTSPNFVRQMLRYGFKKIPRATPKTINLPTITEYRHPNFRADHPELIKKIVRNSITILPKIDRYCLMGRRLQQRNIWKKADPCLKQLRRMSRLEQCRYRLKLVLRMERLRYIIMKKVEKCRETNNFVIELTADTFENTVESVFQFSQPSIAAGYYGNSENGAIGGFFGSYLPTYANDGESEETLEVPTVRSPGVRSFSNAGQFDYQPNIAATYDDQCGLIHDTTDPFNEKLSTSTFGQFTEIHYTNVNDDSVVETTIINGGESINDLVNKMPLHIPEDESIKLELNVKNTMDSGGLTHENVLDLSYDCGRIDGNLKKLYDTQANNSSDIFSEIRESIDILYE